MPATEFGLARRPSWQRKQKAHHHLRLSPYSPAAERKRCRAACRAVALLLPDLTTKGTAT